MQYGGSQVAILNQKFNSILNQGYKLVSSDSNNNLTNSSNNDEIFNGAWYFAIP